MGRGEPGGGWFRSLSPLWAGGPLILLLARALPSPHESYPMYVACLCGINVILAVSLNIVNGLAGQFSLGHAGFMAVGGYASAWISLHAAGLLRIDGIPSGLSGGLLFACGTLLGGAAAALAGLAVGLPSLRLKGDYLAIVTLGFGEIIRVLIENSAFLGGATGLTGLPASTGPAWIMAWVLAVIVFSSRLRRSTHGRSLMAVRDDEVAAEASGVDTTRVKVGAFVVSAFFAGVGGSLLGHFLQILSPKDFTFVKSIEIVAMVVLGGLGSVSGAAMAAVGLTVLPEALRPLQDYTGTDFRMIIYSILLVSFMLARPGGLLGSRELSSLFRRGRRSGDA